MLVPGIHLKPATLQVVSRDVKDKTKNYRRDSGFGFEVAKFDPRIEASNFIDLLNFKFYSTIGDRSSFLQMESAFGEVKNSHVE